MKRNVKKLVVVFAVMATIAALTSAAMANDWKAIHGKYASTSVVTCNMYRPVGVSSDAQTQLGFYTFNGDGTGTAQIRTVRIAFVPNQFEGFSDVVWNFTYEVDDDGTITMDVVIDEAFILDPNTGNRLFQYVGGTWHDVGRFSVDHKTIILGTVEPNESEFLVLSMLPQRITFVTKCNVSRVLTRVGE